MENRLIAVIVRFPSALPTTKSGDPGGHLSRDLQYHQEVGLLHPLITAPQTRFNSQLKAYRYFYVFSFVFCFFFFPKHLLTRIGAWGHPSIDFSI